MQPSAPVITERDQQFLKSYGLELDTPIAYFTRQPQLLVLYMALSLGGYSTYWMYRNWKAVQQATERNISPFWRAVFAIFYAWPLFKIMILQARGRDYRRAISGGLLAITFILTGFSGFTPDSFSGSVTNPDKANIQLMIDVGFSILSALVVLVAQQAVLYGNRRKQVHPYNETEGWEWFWIFILCVFPVALTQLAYR